MKEILLESGIKIPKNAKSAKVLCHSDMDGVFAGILAINQLEKQGISKDRIRIEFVQYGDYDLLDKAKRKNPAQALVSVDFAAYPRLNMESIFSKLARRTGSKEEGYKPEYLTKFADFKKKVLDTSIKPSFNALAKYFRENVGEKADFFTNKKELRNEILNFLKAWHAYKRTNQDDPKKVDITNIDFVSDHHSNEKGDLVSGKAGKIGKTEFKSDTEHMSVVSAQNFITWEDLKEVTKVDSAQYTDIENTILMDKNFRGKGRKERLAVIVNSLLSSMLKSNKRLTAELMKNTQPSLISVYNNLLKYSKLNDKQLQVYSELKKKSPDFDRIEELSKDLPKSIKKNLYNSNKEKIKPTSTYEQMKNKSLQSVKDNINAKTTLFDFKGNVAIQRMNLKKYPPRYLFSLLSKEGKSPVFVIKILPTMIQVSVSPFLKDKSGIDLEKLSLDAIKAAEDKYGTFSNKWLFNIIRENTGGHKNAIYNISGLGAIKAAGLSAGERTSFEKLQSFKKRRGKLSKEGKKRIPTKGSEIKELEGKRTEFSDNIKQFILDFLVKELNSRYKNLELKATSDKYEVK